MSKKWLIASMIIFLAGSGWSRGIGPANARQSALSWMRRVPQFRSAIFLPRAEMRPIRDAGKTTVLAYVLELEPGGFVLVTPDDQLRPILGFSFTSPFDTTESPENHLLLLIRQEMPLRLRAAKEGAINAAYRQESQRIWQALAAPSPSLQQAPAALAWSVEIGPFVPSRWNQAGDLLGNPVFNYYTPNNWVCGCVATAMSQMLYYHRWPETGTGAHAYTWNGQVLSADYGAAAYAWESMVDNYNVPGDEPLANRQAVGALTYHAGVSVDMDYAADGSGAQTEEVATSLNNYFRHNGAWVPRSAADFFDRLYSSMLLSRPATLAIYTSTVGHAIVVDGVRHEVSGTKYYHLNQGWGGYYDAWYDLSGPWNTGGYEWTTIGGAVMDVLPLQDLADPGAQLFSSTVTLNWQDGTNYTPSFYEVQQARLGPELTTFTDGAEAGTDNWMIDGHWKQTTSQRRTGSYSFKGFVSEVESISRSFSTMELDRAIRIEPTTQISYYWGAYYFHNTAARLEISADEKSWSALRTHTSTATALPVSWNAITLSPSDLSSYIGLTVSLRFVVDLTGSSWYASPNVGFYLDDFRIQNAALGSWTVVDNAVAGRSRLLAISQSGDYAWRVRASWNSRWWPWSDVEAASIELPGAVTVQLRALLEGPYAGAGAMRTDLPAQGLIPHASPYVQAPLTADPLPAGAVDWVLVQLYEADGLTPAASRSAFLRSDGQLMDETGGISVAVTGVYKSKSYYIVLRHRNHIAVMSAGPMPFTSGSVIYDFTSGIDQYHGSAGAKVLAGGLYGLWAGDADQDGSVGSADFAEWQSAARAGASGYQAADLRLDGRVTTADYVHWYENQRAGAATGMAGP